MKADLYTSLTRLKMALNDGSLPPMTPLPERAKAVIDPSFTIGGDGWGGLVEDPALGLRCPVRGCGVYRHVLGRHWNAAHRALGGERGLRQIMSLPASAPLASQSERARRVAEHKLLARDNVTTLAKARAARGRIRGLPRGTRLYSVCRRNERDSCETQLSHKVIDLTHKLGRAPTGPEFAAEYGHAKLRAVQVTFGSWGSVLAQCGVERHTTGNTTWRIDAVLQSLGAWHAVHGDFPRSSDAIRPHRTPLIPTYDTILRALGASSWPDAMRTAASMLDIHGGRYGLPERKPTEAA